MWHRDNELIHSVNPGTAAQQKELCVYCICHCVGIYTMLFLLVRPRYGGKYCLGERKRYRVCNTPRCTPGLPSFRQTQCSLFDSVTYKGKLHRWSPVLMASKYKDEHYSMLCYVSGQSALIFSTVCVQSVI